MLSCPSRHRSSRLGASGHYSQATATKMVAMQNPMLLTLVLFTPQITQKSAQSATWRPIGNVNIHHTRGAASLKCFQD